MYAIWEGCGATTWSNTLDNSCDICPGGTYSVGAANADCMACGYGRYCSGGVRYSCPTPLVVSWNAPTTWSDTASLKTECYVSGISCDPGSGLGEKSCYYNDAYFDYCFPFGDAQFEQDFEECKFIGCPTNQHPNPFGAGCTLDTQPCTSLEVGLSVGTGIVITGDAHYLGDNKWDKSACRAAGLPHGGGAVNGSGTKACYYTSGEGESATFNENCSYSISACDGGYYRAGAGDENCKATYKDYYSPAGDIIQTICPAGL